MFIIIQSPIEITLLTIGLLFFVFLAHHRFFLAAVLVLFSAPLYLLKFNIGWLPLTVLESLIWLLFFVWLIKKMKESGARRDFFGVLPKEKILRPILILLIGVILSTIFSTDINTSAGILRTWFLAPLAFGLVLFDIIKTKEQLKDVIVAVVLSSLSVALVALFYLLAGDLTFDGRLKAFYLSPNHLAMYSAPAFIMALGFWFMVKKLWQKILLFIVYCLLFIVLYFTFSYAAWLAIFIALVFIVINIGGRKSISPRASRGAGASRQKLFAPMFPGARGFIIGCLLFIVVLGLFSPQISGNKINDLLNSPRSSWQSRLMIWQSALLILEDHWLVGVGPGMFQEYYLNYQKYFSVPYLEWAAPQPHNLFLAFWLQAGLIGLFGFVWLSVIFFQDNWRHWRKTKPSAVPLGGTAEDRRPLMLFLMAVMLYFLIHGLIDTPVWKNDLSLIFWTIIVLSYKAVRCGD